MLTGDYRPLTTLAIASNLLTCRNDMSTQRLWLQMNVEHLALSMMRSQVRLLVHCFCTGLIPF